MSRSILTPPRLRNASPVRSAPITASRLPPEPYAGSLREIADPSRATRGLTACSVSTCNRLIACLRSWIFDGPMRPRFSTMRARSIARDEPGRERMATGTGDEPSRARMISRPARNVMNVQALRQQFGAQFRTAIRFRDDGANGFQCLWTDHAILGNRSGLLQPAYGMADAVVDRRIKDQQRNGWWQPIAVNPVPVVALIKRLGLIECQIGDVQLRIRPRADIRIWCHDTRRHRSCHPSSCLHRLDCR